MGAFTLTVSQVCVPVHSILILVFALLHFLCAAIERRVQRRVSPTIKVAPMGQRCPLVTLFHFDFDPFHHGGPFKSKFVINYSRLFPNGRDAILKRSALDTPPHPATGNFSELFHRFYLTCSGPIFKKIQSRITFLKNKTEILFGGRKVI